MIMHTLKKRGFISLILSLVVICMFLEKTFLKAQSRSHDLGEYSLRIDADDHLNTNDVDPTGEWPQDYFRYSTIVFYSSGYAIGKWIDSTGAEHVKESTLEGPVSYNETEPYGIKEYRKYEPPEVWVFSEGNTFRSSPTFNGTVDPTIPSDAMIEVRYKAYPGFDVLKRSYSYSNPNHDNYVIHYCRYKVTFDWDQDDEPDTDTNQTLEDVYFIIGYCFQTAEGTYITYSRWYEEGKDDWATYETYSPQVGNGRNLQISYCWDGDHPEITEFEIGGREFDDTGDPRFATGEEGATPLPSGEFISTAYGGFAALHVDSSPTNRIDDLAQPVSIVSSTNVYDLWDNEFPGYTTVWDWAASGTKQTVEAQAGWPDDASAIEGEYPFQAFGPYDLQLGDSIVIVYAVGASGISRALAVEKGLEWRDWYRGIEGATFDDAQKNALIATGKDSLFEIMDRALWTWNKNLDIPDPLPAPDLTVTSGPNRIDLTWEDLSEEGDPDTGVPDLDHYRIYRKRGEFLCDRPSELRADGIHLTWELIATVPKNQNSYIDTNVVRGEPYYYAVSAVDDGTQNTEGLFPGQKLESSKYANRSRIPAYAFEPGRSEASNVRIVPNPYITRAGEFNFSGDDNRIIFVNLPPYCVLRIYTVTGDLVKTIRHETGSADESWDQVTESNQIVASGIYILQVDEAKDINHQPIKGTIEKFVIVR